MEIFFGKENKRAWLNTLQHSIILFNHSIMDTEYEIPKYVEGSRHFYLFESSVRSSLFVSLVVVSRFLYFQRGNLGAHYFFPFEFHTIPFPPEFSRTFDSLLLFFFHVELLFCMSISICIMWMCVMYFIV